MAAVWTELLSGTQQVLQGLGLTYLDGAGVTHPLPTNRVYLRKVPNDRNATLPCLIVARGGKEERLPGSFEDEEAIYPILVVHEFPTNQDLTPNNDELLWRQKIEDAMVEWQTVLKPLVTSCEMTDCEIEFEPVIDLKQFQQNNVDVGGMLLQFRAERGRNRA